MNLLEVLVFKLLAVDALSTCAIALREVTTLDHEALDNAVKARAFVVERLASLADTLLAGAQRAKVLGRLRNDIVVLLKRE